MFYDRELDATRAFSPFQSSRSMTLVSNDPSWWPSINFYRISSYYTVAAYLVLMYDWTLTFGQEVELIWRQRWSPMTVLYLIVRYGGMFYAVQDQHIVCCSNNFDNRCNEHFAPMPSIPGQITGLPCRGEWHSRPAGWCNITVAIAVL